MKYLSFSAVLFSLSLLVGHRVEAFFLSPSKLVYNTRKNVMNQWFAPGFKNWKPPNLENTSLRKESSQRMTLSMTGKNDDSSPPKTNGFTTILRDEANANCENIEFDLIVVGSGNGACGFLAECLKYAPPDYKILVLEEGENFFYISDFTHRNNWSKSYSTGRLFRLHNTRTSDGRPIISGRANAMGGGGSINYTMIHETSKWLAENIGFDSKYFDDIKCELNSKFNLPDVFSTVTKFGEVIERKATSKHFRYLAPEKGDFIEEIPSLKDDVKQFYIFPTQFNEYGQRTRSGVSLVDWGKVHLICNRKVEKILMDEENSSICEGVRVKNGKTEEKENYSLKKGGRLVLACGSQSPRLLMRTPGVNKNEKIGKRVNDHICLPLGLYIIPKNEAALITGEDAYEPVFTSSVIDTKSENNDERSSVKEVVFFDYFSGEIERLLFLASSLYLCYIPFNSLKRLMGRFPILFTFLSNSIRIILIVLVYIYKLLQGSFNVIRGKPFSQSEIVITTSLVKFNSVMEGQYEIEDDLITLKFFEDDNDYKIAEKAIKENLDFLTSMGAKPFFLFRFLFQLLTRIPYKEKEVKRYVKRFSKRTLLSEQHLAGGCIFGDVIDMGIENPSNTGKVLGSENIHVADLSTVPLPRCSTQMTAYLVGHHVGKQLYAPEEER